MKPTKNKYLLRHVSVEQHSTNWLNNAKNSPYYNNSYPVSDYFLVFLTPENEITENILTNKNYKHYDNKIILRSRSVLHGSQLRYRSKC